MTTLTLTIGGVDYMPRYKTGSAKITEQLENRGNTMTLEITKLPGGTTPTEGQEIIFKDGSRYLFGGFVSRIQSKEIGEGQLFTYLVEATDYTYVIINKNAQITYESKTLQYIVQDLVDTYIDPGYGFTYANVDVGPTINTIAFNHISLRKSFEKLAAVTGFEWWIDYQKDVHFKAKDASSAPEMTTDSSDNFIDVRIDVDTSQVRNSIVVKGGREITSSYFQQTIVADGEAREWLLREKPIDMQYINLNGVSKTFGVDPLEDDTAFYFMFNFQEKYIRCSLATPTPALGDEIIPSYKYEVPVIIKLRSASSVLAMQAIEGGDGLHEYTITDTSIKSKSEARDRAMKELLEYANPLFNGTFTTRTGLLQSGSYFKPGQQVTVNLPTWGISVDTGYLIQQVTTTLVEDGTNIEYQYSVRFGGRLLDASSFLQSVAGAEKVTLETEEIDRIEVISEEINIAEVITRNGNVKTVSESISIAESISKTNTTPPFKWAPSATKKGVWNSSEWG